MPAYLVTTITVTKPDQFDAYRKLAGPAVAQYGGKFIVRGGARTILEGKFDANRLVVVSFFRKRPDVLPSTRISGRPPEADRRRRFQHGARRGHVSVSF